MKIGNYELASLETGRFALDGGAMFGIVPKTIWVKTNPADNKNRIELALRVLLLKGENRNIIIDTGIGSKFPDKYQGIYKIDNSKFSLESSLNDHNLSVDDITDVIITHFHFDHAGGGTKMENNKPVPTFPNAEYYVQKRNLDHAKNRNVKDAVSYLVENYKPLIDSGRLKTINGNKKLFSGVSVMEMNGHTVGQQVVKIYDEDNTIVYCGDLIPTASHIHIPFIMGYDLFPVYTMQEKKKFLARAEKDGWILFFEHDPCISACTINNINGKYVKKDVVEI